QELRRVDERRGQRLRDVGEAPRHVDDDVREVRLVRGRMGVVAPPTDRQRRDEGDRQRDPEGEQRPVALAPRRRRGEDEIFVIVAYPAFVRLHRAPYVEMGCTLTLGLAPAKR